MNMILNIWIIFTTNTKHVLFCFCFFCTCDWVCASLAHSVQAQYQHSYWCRYANNTPHALSHLSWWERLAWQGAYQLTVTFVVVFRKKKKDKESKNRLQQVVTSQNEEEVKTKKTYMDKRTPAQIAFDKMQEKRVSYCIELVGDDVKVLRVCYLWNKKHSKHISISQSCHCLALAPSLSKFGL